MDGHRPLIQVCEIRQRLPRKACRLAGKLQSFNSSYLNHYSTIAKDVARFICKIQVSFERMGKKREETKWQANVFLPSWYVCLQIYRKCKKVFQCLKHKLGFSKQVISLRIAVWSEIPYISIKICVDLCGNRYLSSVSYNYLMCIKWKASRSWIIYICFLMRNLGLLFWLQQ